MRRSEIIEATQNVATAFWKSGLVERAKTIGKSPPHGTPEAISIIQSWTRLTRNFGTAESEILQVFGLSKLLDDDFWDQFGRTFLGGVSDDQRSMVYGILGRVVTVDAGLPKFVELLSPESSGDDDVSTDTQSESLGVFTAIVIEPKGTSSTPERLVVLLTSVAELYRACVILTDSPSTALSVISCDSGSDKSFDFLGAAKAIECLKDLILEVWDRVILYREERGAARIKLIAESLPVLERISDMEDRQQIGPEQAQVLRHQVTKGCIGFINAGAMTPDIQKTNMFEPRKLLAPERKLLPGADSADST